MVKRWGQNRCLEHRVTSEKLQCSTRHNLNIFPRSPWSPESGCEIAQRRRQEVLQLMQPRIKFTTERDGPLELPNSQELHALSILMLELEQSGCIPVMYDGLVAGNCAIAAPSVLKGAADGQMVVSRSGKDPGKVMTPQDYVLVTSFDFDNWSAHYCSANPSARPTSDAPPHAAALMVDVHAAYGWAEAPKVIVHGHALAEGAGLETAGRLGFAISEKATLVSTPEDLQQLQELFAAQPYPQQRVFIRRGHGFFLLGSSVEDVRHNFRNLILPHLEPLEEAV